MYRSLSLSASSRYRWNKKVQEFQGVFSPSGGRKEKQLVSLSADPFHLRKHERSEETMRWKDIRSLDKITVLWCPIFPLFFIITILLIFFFVRPRGNLLPSYSTQLNVTYRLQTKHFRIALLWPGWSATKQQHLIRWCFMVQTCNTGVPNTLVFIPHRQKAPPHTWHIWEVNKTPWLLQRAALR